MKIETAAELLYGWSPEKIASVLSEDKCLCGNLKPSDHIYCTECSMQRYADRVELETEFREELP